MVKKSELDAELRLVARIVAGDADALADAFHAHAQGVYDVAYSMTRVVSDAEDVVQDIFAALPERLATFEGRSTLSTWLHTVAVRAAWLRMKNERRWDRLRPEFLAGRLASDVNLPVDRIALERALAAIPAKLRTVILLKVVEGYTHGEIAEMLGIRANASVQRLHRAKRLLRTELGGER